MSPATGASALTVVRAQGTVAAATAATGGALVIVNGSNEQGATLPTRLITQRTTDYNYTTIHRDSYGFTETALATSWYGGPLDAKERKKKAVEHKRNIEMSFFFGARIVFRRHQAAAYHGRFDRVHFVHERHRRRWRVRQGGVAGLPSCRTRLRRPDTEGAVRSPRLCARCSVNSCRTTGFVHRRMTGSGERRLITSSALPLVRRFLWSARRIGSSSEPARANQLGSNAFLVDMSNVAYAPLRDTSLKPNRQANDADERSAEFISECTLIVQRPETHALVKNVTG